MKCGIIVVFVRFKLAKGRARQRARQHARRHAAGCSKSSQSAEWLHLLPLEWTTYRLYSAWAAVAPALLSRWRSRLMLLWLAVKGCDLPVAVRNFWPRFKKGAKGFFCFFLKLLLGTHLLMCGSQRMHFSGPEVTGRPKTAHTGRNICFAVDRCRQQSVKADWL